MLREVIEARLADPEDVVLARDILGTTDPDAIAAQVRAFVPGITGCAQFIQSVGAVFVLDRGDERVVLKIHRFGPGLRDFETFDELAAVYAAQAAVAGRVPCARVLEPPRRFSPGRAAALMSYVDPGVSDDPHAPATGAAMAAEAARLSRLLAGHALPDRTRLPATLLPPAHNALFDFTRAGGEWIDRRAAAARAILDQGVTPAAMHSDFSCANARVVGGLVAAIYDMDSTCLIDEPRCVASMAIHYTYTGETWTWPSREEACAFVAAYEAARGKPFTAAERARLNAGAIYAFAYTARCEHGHTAGPGKMCEALAAAPAAYFD